MPNPISTDIIGDAEIWKQFNACIRMQDEHWVWRGPFNREYQTPYFILGGEECGPHRVAWVLIKQMNIDHCALKKLCSVKNCVNPNCYQMRKKVEMVTIEDPGNLNHEIDRVTNEQCSEVLRLAGKGIPVEYMALIYSVPSEELVRKVVAFCNANPFG